MARNGKTAFIQNTANAGMWKQSLKSMQPMNTVYDARNAIGQTDEAGNFGYSNEPGTELCANLPEGYDDVRGYYFVEERDWHVVFLSNGHAAQIGYVDDKKGEYVKIYDDSECNLFIPESNEYIPADSKVQQPCNELHLYWSVNDYYHVLNLDKPGEIDDCEDLLLFRPNAISATINSKSQKGGTDLFGGAYDIFAQLEDSDGNVTNWFNAGNTVYLGTENNTQEEVSEEGILIDVDIHGNNYDRVNFGVFHNKEDVGRVIASVPYSGGGVQHFYTSRESQYVRDLPLAEVTTKDNGWIRGKDLEIHDGRLILYNVRGERNLDYQERAIAVDVGYKIGRVPLKYASWFTGLRGNEVYPFAIKWNFIDNTSTRWFPLVNKNGGQATGGPACDDCPSDNVANGASRDTMLNGTTAPEEASQDAVRTITHEGRVEYIRFTPTEQSNYTRDDADFLDFSDIPVPDSGDGDGCDCIAYCSLGVAARRILDYAMAGIDFSVDLPDGIGDILGSLFQSPVDIKTAKPQDILAAYKLAEKGCECDCESLADEGVVQPRSSNPSGNETATFNDHDVNVMYQQLNLQGRALGGLLEKEDVKDYLGSIYDYDADGDSLSVSYRSAMEEEEGRRTRIEDHHSRQDDPLGDEDPCFPPGPVTGGPDADAGGETGPEEEEPENPKDGEGDPLTGGNVSLRSEDEEGRGAGDDATGKTCEKWDVTTGGNQDKLDNFSSDENHETSNPADNGSGSHRTIEQTEDRSGITENQNDCEPKIEYEDSECCKVKRVIPCIDSVGKFGLYESCDTYPETKRCDSDEYLYGEWAGKPIRHFRAPDRNIEPHFISYQDGVPSTEDRGNYEGKDTYVRFIWPTFSNIEPPKPEELDKPLNPENPFTIGIIPRNGSNKSVVVSGLIRPTFIGEAYGEDHLIPKHGLSSPEYVSRHIQNQDDEYRRMGRANDEVAAYTMLSPDLAFDTPNINADRLDFLLDLFGKGYRHGLYAEGSDDGNPFSHTKHTKGARSAINVNHYGDNETRQYCIQAASYAPADSIVGRDEGFKFPLLNLSRESSSYFQLDGPYEDIVDGSFYGDVNQHQRNLTGRGIYADVVRNLPNQYGRLEGATFTPIYEGTNEDLAKESFVAQGGDSFIGMHSVKTTSYVSDRVGVNDNSKSLAPIFEEGGGIANLPIIGGFFKRFFSSIGAEDCGMIPKQGPEGANLDPRADNGLNGLRGDKANYPSGDSFIDGTPERDTYFPAVHKQVQTFIVESDVNLGYRGGGDTFAEAHYNDLNGMQVDSSFGGGEEAYRKSFIDEYWSIMTEMGRGWLFLRVLVNAIFTYAIGLGFIVWGAAKAAKTLDEPVIGTSSSYLFPASLVIAGLLALIGIAWILIWGNTNHDNKFWDRVMKIPDCFPDKKIGGGEEPSGYAMDDDRIEWEHRPALKDEFYKFEWDSYGWRPLTFSTAIGADYNTCECLNETTLYIPYSNKQDPGSYIDAFRNFKVNNFAEIPANSGPLKKIFHFQNQLFAHTSDTMYNLRSSPSQAEVSDDVIYLGRGDFMNNPIDMFSGPSEGSYGLLDPNACIITKHGYIFIDREARDIYKFTGSGAPESIARKGLKSFIDNNLYFEGLEDNPDTPWVDEKLKDGMSYALGWDPRHDRILITKVDKDEDTTFTVSYNILEDKWVSFHDYHPLVYAWNRQFMYSFADGAFWRHFSRDKFTTYYGKEYDFSLDFVLRHKETLESFDWNDMVLDTEAYTYDEETGQYIRNHKVTFDKIAMWNSYQNSGVKELVNPDGKNTIERMKESNTEVPISFMHRRWRYNQVFDYLNDHTKPMLTADNGSRQEIIEENINKNLRNKKFTDHYLVNRLIFSKLHNTRLIFKLSQASIEFAGE